MNGFFTAVKKVSKKAVPAKKVTHSCMDCPLREQDCSKNEAVVNGNGRKILILTGTTNIQTRNFERLESELSRVGISLENDCFWTSVIQSIHPYHKVMLKNGESKEQKDSHRYLECCRPKIHRLIFKHRPLAILALGDFAITSLVADRSNFRNKFGSIDNWEGACVPDRKFGSWIIPTWSIPALVQAEEGKDKNGKVYLRHFRRSLSMLAQVVKKGVYPEVGNDEDRVEVILDDNKAIERMKQCKEYFKKYPDDVLSFDYETTGLKPYLPKQKIICVSLAWKTNHALAFELNDRTWPEFESILFDKNIRKCAHNIAFEHLWTLVKSPSHKGVEGWGQDTQLDAHILDNRTGNAGLKKQTYLNFGIAGYDDEVDGYLEADYPNDINRIRELPIATVLKYCALDSLYGLRLAKKQDKEFAKKARVNPKILEARKLFLEGAVTLSEMGAVGFKIDKGILRTNKQEIQKKIADLYDEIMQDPDVVRWKKRMGSEFNLNSNDQLSDTLFNQMKLPKPDKVTASGKIATDSNTLSDYEVPFLEKKSEIKKLEKLMGTYVDAVEREAPDGFLHCFFSLNGPRTFRSSSSDINLQNIPKRWPYAKKIIRRCMFPAVDGCFFEADYKSLEVGIGCAYHKDTNMLQYLKGEGDMHRDAALDAFLLRDNPELMTKTLRQGGKNGFVFPEFYGDYYGNCAVELWKNYVCKEKLADGTPLMTWMKKHKIRDFDDFVEHMADVEHILWHKRFADFGRWRDDFFNEYVRTGEYWNYTGFPYYGIMNRKDSSNYAIQGSAFHVNLYAMNRLHAYIKKNDMKSRLCGEIHDAIEGVISPDELNTFIPLLHEIMVDRCKAKFPWVIAPLEIEIELAPLNHSWGEMEPISKRDIPCSCGAEWGYKGKPDESGIIKWKCPICDSEVTEKA